MTDRHESRASTHADNCWSWGPGHYECAVGKIKHLREVLRLAEEHINAITPEWYSAGQRVLAAIHTALEQEKGDAQQPADGEFMTLKRFIELELAKIEPLWTAVGKGSYWWGVKIGLETALAKLCEMEGQAPASQQPAADPRSTHRVWRGDDWQPCYCEATDDHRIGSEQPAAPSAPVGVEGTWLWGKLMDWCREQRIAPATQNKLFAIAGEAHRLNALARQPATVDDVVVERIAALLHEETTGEPWTVAGVEHPGPDRDYYRGLARKVATLAAAQQPSAAHEPCAADGSDPVRPDRPGRHDVPASMERGRI